MDQRIAVRDQGFAFGPFRLFPSRQLLLDGDQPLAIGSRALEILTILVERAGVVVGKDDIFARVWPDTFVAEGNLRVHVSALRQALADGRASQRYIANIPGKGYSFVAPVSLVHERHDSSSSAPPLAARRRLPLKLTRIFGRDRMVDSLCDQLPQRRLITLVGPGGIGKTTVALAAADRLYGSYGGGARFLDLAPLTDPGLVATALASAIGDGAPSDSSLSGSVQFLAQKKMLLVLDNCEHVVEAAATAASAILAGTEHVHIIATSREPLFIAGETVQRLAALDFPEVSAEITASVALGFPAVQLFVERAAASSEDFDLTDGNAALVVDICRRLDGMALAIELAASSVGALGAKELAARLDDRFKLLSRGRRTALPRHRTLEAALDWSHDLLTQAERKILRRTAVLSGRFSMDAAQAVAASPELAADDVVDGVANLVAKSLVVADVVDGVSYRLLETTRSYASRRLDQSGERNVVARRHAEYFRDMFVRGTEGGGDDPDAGVPTVERAGAFLQEIDNVRAALDWAFAPGGDTDIGISLTAAYAPVWLHFFFIAECRERVERALECLGPDSKLSDRFVLQLNITLAQALNIDRGADTPGRVDAILARTLEIAESLEDAEAQMQVLWITQVSRFNKGALKEADAVARRFLDVARQVGDPFDIGGGHRLIGGVDHYAGNQSDAYDHLKLAVEMNVRPAARKHVMWAHYDQHVISQTRLARVLCLRGLFDQAAKLAEEALGKARARDHGLSACMVLAEAIIPIAVTVGDLDLADRSLAQLNSILAERPFALWKTVASCLEGKLRVQRFDFAGGCAVLGPALDKLMASDLWLYYSDFVNDLARGRAATLSHSAGLELICFALSKAAGGVAWSIPEHLRMKGELLLQQGLPGGALLAEHCFHGALEIARGQGAQLWVILAGLSLAQLYSGQGSDARARAVLAPIYDSFTEGFGSTPMLLAKSMLMDSTK